MKQQFAAALALSVLALGGAYQTASAATLIHRYTFDGAPVVDSVGSIDGTLIGDADLSGGALNLDGFGDYVQLGGKAVPTGATAFSVTLFATQTMVQGGFVELISQGSSGGPGFYIGHDSSHNFRLGDQLTSTGLAFPDDLQEHFYALTSGADGTRLYIDAALSFSSVTQIAPGGADDTRIGAQFGPFGEFFRGTIDDLRIYSGALTAEEVAAIASEADQVPEPASLAIMGACIAALGLTRRRASRSAA